MAHMHTGGLHEPDVAINTASGIPARRVRRVIQTNRQNVLFSVFDVRRKVEFERRVSVGPAADELPVEPNGCVRHRTVDIQIELLSLFGRRYVEMFSKPGYTPPGKLAGFPGIILVEWSFDAPIVR